MEVMHLSLLLLVVCVLLQSYGTHGAEKDRFQAKLKAAISKIDTTIAKITERWEIESYPNFLKSVAMSHKAWDIMKVSY